MRDILSDKQNLYAERSTAFALACRAALVVGAAAPVGLVMSSLPPLVVGATSAIITYATARGYINETTRKSRYEQQQHNQFRIRLGLKPDTSTAFDRLSPYVVVISGLLGLMMGSMANDQQSKTQKYLPSATINKTCELNPQRPLNVTLNDKKYALTCK